MLSGLKYAMKVLRRPSSKKVFYHERGNRPTVEILVMKMLRDHPSFVHLHEVIHKHSDHTIYLIMDLCEGGQLIQSRKTMKIVEAIDPVISSDDSESSPETNNSEEQKQKIVKERKTGPRKIVVQSIQFDPLPPILATYYLRDLLPALHKMHSMGIIHRDIKPPNLLLMNDGRLKISDFGACAILKHAKQKLKETAGTVAFLAPEVFKGGLFEGPPVDSWSVGITTYIFCFGTFPFGSDNDLTDEQLINEIQTKDVVFPASMPDIMDSPENSTQHLTSTDPETPQPPQSSAQTVPVPLTLKHFISSLLCKDPAQRMTIPEACVHPWLLEGFTRPIPLSFLKESGFEDADLRLSEKMLHWRESETSRWRRMMLRESVKPVHQLLGTETRALSANSEEKTALKEVVEKVMEKEKEKLSNMKEDQGLLREDLLKMLHEQTHYPAQDLSFPLSLSQREQLELFEEWCLAYRKEISEKTGQKATDQPDDSTEDELDDESQSFHSSSLSSLLVSSPSVQSPPSSPFSVSLTIPPRHKHSSSDSSSSPYSKETQPSNCSLLPHNHHSFRPLHTLHHRHHHRHRRSLRSKPHTQSYAHRWLHNFHKGRSNSISSPAYARSLSERRYPPQISAAPRAIHTPQTIQHVLSSGSVCSDSDISLHLPSPFTPHLSLSSRPKPISAPLPFIPRPEVFSSSISTSQLTRLIHDAQNFSVNGSFASASERGSQMSFSSLSASNCYSPSASFMQPSDVDPNMVVLPSFTFHPDTLPTSLPVSPAPISSNQSRSYTPQGSASLTPQPPYYIPYVPASSPSPLPLAYAATPSSLPSAPSTSPITIPPSTALSVPPPRECTPPQSKSSSSQNISDDTSSEDSEVPITLMDKSGHWITKVSSGTRHTSPSARNSAASASPRIISSPTRNSPSSASKKSKSHHPKYQHGLRFITPFTPPIQSEGEDSDSDDDRNDYAAPADPPLDIADPSSLLSDENSFHSAAIQNSTHDFAVLSDLTDSSDSSYDGVVTIVGAPPLASTAETQMQPRNQANQSNSSSHTLLKAASQKSQLSNNSADLSVHMQSDECLRHSPFHQRIQAARSPCPESMSHAFSLLPPPPAQVPPLHQLAPPPPALESSDVAISPSDTYQQSTKSEASNQSGSSKHRSPPIPPPPRFDDPKAVHIEDMMPLPKLNDPFSEDSQSDSERESLSDSSQSTKSSGDTSSSSTNTQNSVSSDEAESSMNVANAKMQPEVEEEDEYFGAFARLLDEEDDDDQQVASIIGKKSKANTPTSAQSSASSTPPPLFGCEKPVFDPKAFDRDGIITIQNEHLLDDIDGDESDDDFQQSMLNLFQSCPTPSSKQQNYPTPSPPMFYSSPHSVAPFSTARSAASSAGSNSIESKTSFPLQNQPSAQFNYQTSNVSPQNSKNSINNNSSTIPPAPPLPLASEIARNRLRAHYNAYRNAINSDLSSLNNSSKEDTQNPLSKVEGETDFATTALTARLAGCSVDDALSLLSPKQSRVFSPIPPSPFASSLSMQSSSADRSCNNSTPASIPSTISSPTQVHSFAQKFSSPLQKQDTSSDVTIAHTWSMLSLPISDEIRAPAHQPIPSAPQKQPHPGIPSARNCLESEWE
ncbi:putative Serine/Threonine kinase domain protein [Monocercomonoides exilis]|uniref:putative Serine/Threonine kinase domain protein n=1 Tax=Monocercomonoides exilis TaxID=2049356 RepID=UPI00355AC8BD|nr:putative Serine/Threonine kinase domain protein [Monocercomonoides exilis]|eukprot:MONOS_9891.1-p1 / transcript=MONOS_9891.1 / gene=MONOS_9891 / organism=Monocercomonoides_exilis_PA203 / gene_product=Protein kinase domain containing protein / transcript_product=Protein kinase domain containing protein / location=Mono_scaffold00425:3786-8673(-) / protein_length=1611 / sequence_SO=supercontig / SO=protein_coding / is_pseudo=false